MQAIQTTFISPTDSLSPRIKVSAGGESVIVPWKSGLTIQENHHLAAKEIAMSLDWLRGGLELVTGWMGEGTYVHTFGPARDGSDCSMCGAYAPTADGMVHEGAFICSDCVHDNDIRTDTDQSGLYSATHLIEQLLEAVVTFKGFAPYDYGPDADSDEADEWDNAESVERTAREFLEGSTQGLPGLDVGSHKEERDMTIVALRLMLDKHGHEDHESAVAKRVLLLLESRNKWIGGGDLKFALGGLLDCMGYDATPKGLLDRLGWSVEEFDGQCALVDGFADEVEVPGLYVVEADVPSHPCDGCGVPVREDEYLGYDKPDGETEYKCENCFGEKYSGISEEERQWFPDGDDGFRLFKAAPELLEVLEDVAGLIEDYCEDHNSDRPTDVTVVLSRVLAAIAKAKGGE